MEYHDNPEKQDKHLKGDMTRAKNRLSRIKKSNVNYGTSESKMSKNPKAQLLCKKCRYHENLE